MGWVLAQAVREGVQYEGLPPSGTAGQCVQHKIDSKMKCLVLVVHAYHRFVIQAKIYIP